MLFNIPFTGIISVSMVSLFIELANDVDALR